MEVLGIEPVYGDEENRILLTDLARISRRLGTCAPVYHLII